MKWKGHMRPWYGRPLRCLIGLHPWQQHPGVPSIVWCPECDMERTK